MRPTCLCIGLLIGMLATPAAPQAPSADADVKKGIQQTEDGDYDGAILTLDNAARRLAADPSKSRDLSQAYLYLGIAYVGKGHEAAAKAKFREALRQIRDLQLTPDKFPPKVINLFEAAKEESAQAAAPPSAQAAATGKKGGHKGLLIGGALALGAGGAAIGLSGGKSSGSGATGGRTSESFGPITLQVDQYDRAFNVFVARSGMLDATLTWQEGGVALGMDLYDESFSTSLASSNQTGNQESRLNASVQPTTSAPRKYIVTVVRNCGDCNGPINFTLTVIHP